MVADTSFVGDEILIVRVSADATQEQADALASEIREVVERHGSGFAVVVVRAGERQERCAAFHMGPFGPLAPILPFPVDHDPQAERPVPRRWTYPVC